MHQQLSMIVIGLMIEIGHQDLSLEEWMLNEMGAMMSLIHGDEVKPMAGLARAYPKWKRQHDIAAAEQTR